MSSSGSGVSDSQSSQISNFSLGWSQETTNQVLKAVGMNASDGDRMIQLYHSSHLEDEDEEEIGTSELSVSRAVFNVVAQTQQPPLNSTYPPPSSSQPPAYPSNSCTSPLGTGTGYPTAPSLLSSSTPSTPHTITSLTPSPAPPTPQRFTWESNASSLPPPPSLHPPPPPSLLPSCVFTNTSALKSNIPTNLPYPGDYDFGLVFEEDRKKSLSKNTTCTYFGKMQRLYIKLTAVVPFSFTINRSPPPNCILRAMAIHKTPEMISENLVCCHKHMDEQTKAGILFPQHFIRSHNPEAFYHDNSVTGRLSVTVPCCSLLKKSEDVYTSLYTFPCYTSDVQKSGQQVQIVFTLERDSVVLGRCTVDIRVCASPGRDRSTDERKLAGEGVSSDNVDGSTAGVTTRRGRKRRAGRDVVQCTLPPKQVCLGLAGRKVQHTITTHPELIPYIDVCVRMMEKVYSVKVEAGGTSDGPVAASNSHEEMFTSLDRWLEHLDLTRYQSMLHSHGVSDLFQVPGVTDEELRRWGMSNAEHRKAFLDGKSRIQLIKQEDNVLEDSSQDVLNQSSPALFPSTPSSQPAPLPLQLSQGSQQLSQISTSSTQPFSQAFEVMHIQVTKKFSNSQL